MELAYVIPIALIFAPGVWASIQGRRLLRFVDDPAVPERLMAYRQRNSTLAWISIFCIFATFGRWRLPACVAAVIGVMIGSFPLRRAVFGETWTLRTYVSSALRVALSIWGFWLVLLITPILIHDSSVVWWIMGPAVAAFLMVWSHYFISAFVRLTGARPLVTGDMQPRFDAINERSTISRPSLWMVPANGGKIANAFALPSRRVPAVIFTEALLAALTSAESAAIYAHEVAHLEHYTASRLRRLNAITVTAVVAGTILLPALAYTNPTRWSWTPYVWSACVALALFVRLARHQKHEAESDRRATELCGDAESLASGLLKLAAMTKSPRRWQVEAERLASHPSFATRIRQIRAGEGAEEPGLETPVIVASTVAGRFAVFERNTFNWLEEATLPEGASLVELRAAAKRAESLAYTELADLRVSARALGAPKLVARDHSDRRWSMPIRPQDVPRIQAALDCVDAVIKPKSRPWFAERLPTSVLGFGMIVSACTVGSPTLAPPLLLGFLAVFRPNPAVFLAAGAAGLVSVSYSAASEAAATAVVSVLALLLGALWQRDAAEPEPMPFALGLASILGVATWAIILWLAAGASLGRLHALFAAAPSAAAWAAATGAALFTVRRRSARVAAGACLVLAAVAVGMGSARILARLVDDPLAPGGKLMRQSWAALEEVHRFAFDGRPGGVTLAPGGGALAVQLLPDGDDDHLTDEAGENTFVWFRASGTRQTLKGLALQLVDDRHALALVGDGDGLSLRRVEHSGPQSATEITRLPNIGYPTLEIGARGGVWRVTQWRRDDEIRVFEGREDQPGYRDLRLKLPSTRSSYFTPAVSVEGVIAVRNGWVALRPSILRLPFELLGSLTTSTGTAELWTFAGEPTRRASSLLEVSCHAPPVGDVKGSFFCTSWDGAESGLFAVDPISGVLTPRGRVPIQLEFASRATDGRFFNWVGRRHLAVVNVDAAEVVRMEANCGRARESIALAWPHFAACEPGLCRVYRIQS